MVELSVRQSVPWRRAMAAALYGPGGFYTSTGPAAHFRTSAVGSDLFAAAVLRLVGRADDALGRPDPLDLVDVGAGRGELLCRLSALASRDLRRRLRLVAIERATRPGDVPADIGWTEHLPPRRSINGVLVATEWLDNVALDLAAVDRSGVMRYLLVEPGSGAESLGEPVSPSDRAWARQWYGAGPWPTGTRLELGGPRDAAWARAVAALRRGLAITVDYGHTRDTRPRFGTLAGYRGGREVRPVPDGSCDLTVHVAMDAVMAAGERVAGMAARLTTQREALTWLGVDASRPPLDVATSDPAGYVRALAAATEAAEMTAPDGLGGHFWLIQPVAVNKSTLFGTTR